jgi:hypothetical protein
VTHSPDPTESQTAGRGITRPIRRLTLADGLILIAAVAAGFGIARIPRDAYGQTAAPGGDVSLFAIAIRSVYWASLLVMVALIPLRLMPPRPPLRLIRRQPGFIACAAVLFGMAHTGVYFAINRIKQPTFWANIDALSLIASPSIGSLLITSWFVLAISGRWRAEPSSIDRSGRLLAIAWIVRYIIHFFVEGWV